MLGIERTINTVGPFRTLGFEALETLTAIYPSPAGHGTHSFKLVEIGLSGTVPHLKQCALRKVVYVPDIEGRASFGVFLTAFGEEVSGVSAIRGISDYDCNMRSSNRVPPSWDARAPDYIVCDRVHSGGQVELNRHPLHVDDLKLSI